MHTHAPPGFRELAARLIRYLNERIRRGEMSERALARLVGYSQPHIHNVLKGTRALMPETADHILDLLGIQIISLFTQEELGGIGPPETIDFRAVPVLDGRLGAGKAFPETTHLAIRYFLPAHLAGAAVNPVVALLDSSETSMFPLLEPGDRVLLDRSPAARRHPQFEHVYALCWKHKTFVVRCRVVGSALVPVSDNPHSGIVAPDRIALADQDILEIVRGRVAWSSREL